MEYFTGVYLTDEELQSGKQYQVKELEKMVWMSKGGSPSSISHDIHRTVGWTKVNGMYFSHERCYVLGRTGFPETDQEINVSDSLPKWFIRKGMTRLYSSMDMSLISCYQIEDLTKRKNT